MSRMVRLSLLLPLFAFSAGLYAQMAVPPSRQDDQNQVFAGYSLFSNSFNGHSSATSHVPLNGWDAAFARQIAGRFSARIDVSGYYGTSLGSPQHPLFVLGGAQYNRPLRRFTGFVDGLVGFGHLNSNWWGGQFPGNTNSFAGEAGVGLDTPISPHLGFRVEGDLVYANFTIQDNQIHGLPNYFARIITGLVWNF